MKGFLRERKSTAGDGEGRAEGATEQDPVHGLDTDFTNAELEEFLAADHVDVPADPVFKEQLRETLWRMVLRSRSGDDGEPEGGSG
ncbi:MAG TPA: hypothetical protein VMW35_04580 [Myxococcota bacterium]|nr:hypothetical protein [Myxococcota bacterium]